MPKMTKFRHLFAKNQPALMLGAGLAGMVTTTILAVRGHAKAVKKMNELEYEEVYYTNKKGKPKVRKLNWVKKNYKCYIPAAVVGSLSLGCLIGSYKINHKRNAALASSLALSEAAMTEYQKAVADSIGETAEREIRNNFNKKEITTVETQKQFQEQSEYLREGKCVKCYESSTQQSFWSSKEGVKKVINELNQERLTGIGTEITLNEFYSRLGLLETSVGNCLGWDVQNPVDVDFSTIEVDDIPCLYIRPLNLVSLM